jgi:anaerobic magnesium-protoporphyrin IX monomethyl ester cyclase
VNLGLPIDVVLVTMLDGDLVQMPEHLGVAYLASELRAAGRSVELVVCTPQTESTFVSRVAVLSPQLVGISLTTASFGRTVALGSGLRSALGERVHITAGGPPATHLGAALLNTPGWSFLDSVVRGEGELAIVQLAGALERSSSLSHVSGLCYRTPTGIVCNPTAKPKGNLNSIPMAARDQLHLGPNSTARISTSRGCTSRCSFCNAPNANYASGGKVWRGRNPEDVVAEIEHLHLDLGVNDFEFVDSTFEDPGGTPWAKTRIATIAQLILERKLSLSYGCCVQAQNWKHEDLWLIALLNRAGLQRVLIGIESGADATLRRWSKKATLTDNRLAIELFQSQGVYVNPGFIMFHPHSDRREMAENAAFLRAWAGHNLRLYCTRLELYPGTPIVDELRSEGLLLPDYDATFRVFAYRFVDSSIARISHAMALLAGEEYAQHGTVSTLPPHFRFAFADAALHRFLFQQSRMLKNCDLSRLDLDHLRSQHRARCSELRILNSNVFACVCARIDAGLSAKEAVADLKQLVDSGYAEKLEEVDKVLPHDPSGQMTREWHSPPSDSLSLAGLQ